MTPGLSSGGAMPPNTIFGEARLFQGVGKVAVNLFAGFEGSPGEIDVTKIDIETFTKVTERMDIYSGFNSLLSGGLYDFMGWANPGIINKLDLDDLSTLDSLTFGAGEFYINGYAQKGNYLYAGMSSPSGSEEIIRCTKTPFAKDTKLTVGEGINGTLIIDGAIMYCITRFEANDKVIKIDLTNFTKGAVLPLGQTINDGLAADVVISEGYLYVGIPRDPGRIVKVNLATFSVDSTLTLNANHAEARGLAVHNGYLYVGCYEAPGKIAKIALSTFTQVDSLTLATNEDVAYDMVVYNDILYVLCYNRYLVRVDLATFTRIDSLDLGALALYATDLTVA